jgi:hypothetical protein
MKDPVIASDGYSYERQAIERMFLRQEMRSPMTRKVLEPVARCYLQIEPSLHAFESLKRISLQRQRLRIQARARARQYWRESGSQVELERRKRLRGADMN